MLLLHCRYKGYNANKIPKYRIPFHALLWKVGYNPMVRTVGLVFSHHTARTCQGCILYVLLRLTSQIRRNGSLMAPWPKKKKTATMIMHKIRTLFLSLDIEKSSLIAPPSRCKCNDAGSRSKPRHRANLVILRDKNSVLILCIIVVAVFFFLARVVLIVTTIFNRHKSWPCAEAKRTHTDSGTS